MRHLLLVATILLSSTAAAAQDPAPGKCFVKDGRTAGVCYGMSLLADLWGNFRRQVFTLRPDGTLLFGAPEGGFEDFLKRELTEGEKAGASSYSIEGGKFLFRYRDGSKSEGTVEYASDGSIKRIMAAGLNIFPILPGVGALLSGSWSNTFSFNNAAYKMSTTGFNNFSFFENGVFVHEKGAGTIATAVQERTRESSAGIETVRDEVLKFYGSESPSKMGKFEVKGSALKLTYDNGTKEARFIGRIGESKAGEKAMLLIGGGLYEGTFGVFPKSSSAPTPAAAEATPPAGLARCSTAQFDLAVTAGWHARKEDYDGLQAFLLTPSHDSEGKFTMVLTGTALDDKSTKAADPAMVASVEALVTGWVKNEKISKVGGPEAFRIGAADAVRVTYSLTRDGGPVRIEAACAVREGNAMIVLTIASEAAMKQHGAAARELLGKAVVAGAAPEPKVELRKATGHGYELDIPKAWSAKETEQNGVKTLMIVPPAGESEFVIQLIPTDTEHASATDAAAITELRELVKQLSPVMEPIGNVESLQAGGRPVSGVVYGGQNEKQETILVKAYLAVKAKKAVVVLVVGKEARDKEYRALVRKALESLTLK